MAGVRIASGKLPFPDEGMVDEIARRTLLEVNAIAASRVKEILLSGRDSRGFVGRKDEGVAHANVGSQAPKKAGTSWRGVTGFAPPRDAIGNVLEKGRKRGARMPPPDALIPWAKRKLRNQLAAGMRGARTTARAAARFKAQQAKAAARGHALGKGEMPKVSGVGKAKTDAAAERLAFALARSISKKGTPGLHMFEQTAKYLRNGKAAEVLKRVTRRVIAERGGSR